MNNIKLHKDEYDILRDIIWDFLNDKLDKHNYNISKVNTIFTKLHYLTEKNEE